MAKLPGPKEMAESEVLHLAAFFEDTGNVAAAWRCWHLARKLGCPVPPLIAAEVDRFASVIAEVTDAALAGDSHARLDSKMLSRLWAAPMLSKNKNAKDLKGKNEPAQALFRWNRNIDAAFGVHVKRQSGLKEREAVEAVSRERGMGDSSVRAAVNGFREAEDSDEMHD